ncbi:MAG: hypothetical protein ACLUJI_01295 [Faecalibacillus faecis]|uniref:hypothetical protein n=1 Tax=Faecalibacillus faecis TaxID=1982628 RepID=UPI0039918F28
MTVRKFLEMQYKQSGMTLEILVKKNDESYQTVVDCNIFYWESIKDDILNLLVTKFAFESKGSLVRTSIWCEEDR